MSDRTERLLALHVMLVVLLVVSQTTVVPRSQIFGSIGVLFGAIAVVYALVELPLDELGLRVRVDYAADGEYGREWLRELLDDLGDDGLVDFDERDGTASLRR